MSLKFDKIFIIIITIVLVCAIAYPIWLGHNMSDENKVFSGVVGLYPGESFYYLALGPAEMADEQRVMGEDKFMRADKAMFINPIGNCIALISDLTTWDNTTSFFLYRLFAAILLVISFVRLSSVFLSGAAFRFLALSLFIFGSGWDVCIDSLGACSWSITAPEINPFIASIGEYYIPTAIALLLFYLERLFHLLKTSTPLRKNLFVSGALLFILGVVYIYAMLIAISLSASLLLYYRLKKKSTTPETVKIIVWNALFSLPVIIYYVWLYTNLNSTAQDVGWVMGPSLVETLLTNFWVAVPAILLVAFGLAKNDKRDDWMALAVWVATILIITRIPPPYLPFQVQAHIGLSAPLSIMTAVGLQRLYGSGRVSRLSKPLALSISALLLFFSIQTNWNFYTQMLNRIEQMEYPEFVDKDELESFIWIRENLSQSATFAVVEERARILAGFTGCRVFYRNTPFHEFSETKKVLTTWSDAIGKGDAGCPSTLINHEISYVFVSPLFREKYLNPISIDNIPCSKCIYSSGKFSIWQLNKVQ
jgi:hypothetical protein